MKRASADAMLAFCALVTATQGRVIQPGETANVSAVTVAPLPSSSAGMSTNLGAREALNALDILEAALDQPTTTAAPAPSPPPPSSSPPPPAPVTMTVASHPQPAPTSAPAPNSPPPSVVCKRQDIPGTTKGGTAIQCRDCTASMNCCLLINQHYPGLEPCPGLGG